MFNSKERFGSIWCGVVDCLDSEHSEFVGPVGSRSPHRLLDDVLFEIATPRFLALLARAAHASAAHRWGEIARRWREVDDSLQSSRTSVCKERHISRDNISNMFGCSVWCCQCLSSSSSIAKPSTTLRICTPTQRVLS